MEQANLLSAPRHEIWHGLPAELALQLASQLSEIHRNALSVIAWFENDHRARSDADSPLSLIRNYVDEADRFFETLAKTGYNNAS